MSAETITGILDRGKHIDAQIAPFNGLTGGFCLFVFTQGQRDPRSRQLKYLVHGWCVVVGRAVCPNAIAYKS